MVTCGLADAEDASIACPHQCERRHLAAHEETCEFRAIECERCDARISARRARDHARVCPKRAERCDGCGVEIAASKMETHQKYHCGADTLACEYAPYGCAECGSREELAAHVREDASRHLRLVMLRLDATAAEFKAYENEVVGVKAAMTEHVRVGAADVEAVGAEVRRIDETATAEIDALREGLGELRAFYEEEVDRLEKQAERAKAFNDARVKDLESENAALRAVLESKMPREECDAFVQEMTEAKENATAVTTRVNEAVETHVERWKRDAKKVRDEASTATRECADAVADLKRRVDGLDASDQHRFERAWESVQKTHDAFAAEILDVGRSQRALEERWRESNASLRGDVRARRSVLRPDAKAPLEPANAREEKARVRRPTEIGTARDEGALSKFRAQGAAKLLFGSGAKLGGKPASRGEENVGGRGTAPGGSARRGGGGGGPTAFR